MKKLYFIKAMLVASVIMIAAISAGMIAAEIVVGSVKPIEKNVVTQIYVVKEGDSVKSIALQYCSPEVNPNFLQDFLRELKYLNPYFNEDDLKAGDELKLLYRRK